MRLSKKTGWTDFERGYNEAVDDSEKKRKMTQKKKRRIVCKSIVGRYAQRDYFKTHSETKGFIKLVDLLITDIEKFLE